MHHFRHRPRSLTLCEEAHSDAVARFTHSSGDSGNSGGVTANAYRRHSCNRRNRDALLADELARIFWQKGTYVDYVDYVDNYVEKWLEWPERPP